MLGTVLDKITGLVGRASVISAILPTFLFAAANAATLAALVGVDDIVKRWKALEGLQVVSIIGLFLVTVAAAYVLMTVSPILKRLLEGAYPLVCVGKLLVRQKRKRFNQERGVVLEKLSSYSQVRRKCENWVHALQDARKQSANRKASAPQETDKLPRTRAILEDLEEKAATIEKLSLEEIEKTAGEVKDLYDCNYPVKEVDPLHGKVIQLLEDFKNVAHASYSGALADVQFRYAFSEGVGEVRPTALGNIMAAAWSYPLTRYGIDATIMWPRLQKVIPAEYFRVVEDARIPYDFSVNMTFLSMLYACTWLALLVAHGPSRVWLLIPAMALYASALFYCAAIEAARGFGEVFCTCFDLFRFSLLQELRIEIPTDEATERETWDRINKLLLFAERGELKYTHPATK